MGQEMVGIDEHDTVVGIVVGEDSNDFILIRSRSSGLWRFPGDRIREEDLDLGSCEAAAENALMRIVRQRTGLILVPRGIRRVMQVRRPLGTLYGYAVLADFTAFAPHDPENVEILSLSGISDLEMSRAQRIVFSTVVEWIRS